MQLKSPAELSALGITGWLVFTLLVSTSNYQENGLAALPAEVLSVSSIVICNTHSWTEWIQEKLWASYFRAKFEKGVLKNTFQLIA